jgi:Calcineurin-like phosphoesterase
MAFPTVDRLLLLLAVLLLVGCGKRIVPSTRPIPLPGPDELETTLFLIGDAGAPAAAGEPVFTALETELAGDTARSLVLFLGDNIYPRGLPRSSDPEFARAAGRLDAQVDLLLRHGVRGILLPGNHDWDRFGPDGWEAIRRQGERIARRGGDLVRLLPADGCPGPEVVDAGRQLRLILLDTQWWLHGGDKPRDGASGCAHFSEQAVIGAMAAALATAGGRRVIVAAHHPIVTGGEHGGFFDWHDHLFPLRNVARWLWLPLPALGSLYPISRGLGITSQDVTGPRYRRLRQALERAFRNHPPLVYATGHDHNLQVIAGTPARYQLVSGAGILGHEGPVTEVPGTVLALQEAGFMRVDVYRDGRIRLGVLIVDRSGRGSEVYSRWLEPLVRNAAVEAPQEPATH